ncbi:hypothetical protein [Kribbella lupini]|uniref:hypothetical protein n=1 Tax=Kribbella lupini TaxID=291602 RepID=UPI0031D7636F
MQTVALRGGCDARQVVEREEREAVRGAEGQGHAKERAAKIANAPKSSEHGGQQSGKGGNSKQGGTTAQKKKAGSKGGKATASKS